MAHQQPIPTLGWSPTSTATPTPKLKNGPYLGEDQNPKLKNWQLTFWAPKLKNGQLTLLGPKMGGANCTPTFYFLGPGAKKLVHPKVGLTTYGFCVLRFIRLREFWLLTCFWFSICVCVWCWPCKAHKPSFLFFVFLSIFTSCVINVKDFG